MKLAVRENVAGAKAQLDDLASWMPHYGPKRGVTGGEGSEAGEAI